MEQNISLAHVSIILTISLTSGPFPAKLLYYRFLKPRLDWPLHLVLLLQDAMYRTKIWSLSSGEFYHTRMLNKAGMVFTHRETYWKKKTKKVISWPDWGACVPTPTHANKCLIIQTWKHNTYNSKVDNFALKSSWWLFINNTTAF